MASEWARQKASEAWLTHETKHITFDGRLAEAFADILDKVADDPPTDWQRAKVGLERAE